MSPKLREFSLTPLLNTYERSYCVSESCLFVFDAGVLIDNREANTAAAL